MGKDFIHIKDVKKYFGGVKALDGVNLTVCKGEIHCLAGENGSGKSTLIKVISGIHAPDSGEVVVDGKIVDQVSPIEAIRSGIQVIYQDFAVFPNLTVAENIAMNQLILKGKKLVNRKAAERIATEALTLVGSDLDVNLRVEQLTVANKQLVAICRAIITDAQLLILDEPTTALTANEVKKLNKVIKKLCDGGMAILIVNHKLNEIYEVADRLTIIRNGKTITSGRIEEYGHQRFMQEMTGRNLSDDSYRISSKLGKPVLAVENLSRAGVFKDVSFTLQEGDILGITGLLGSGRGELGEAIFGVTPAESGKIKLKGETIRIDSPSDAMSKGVAYVPPDRLTQGLFMTRSIIDNTVASSLEKYFWKGRLDRRLMAEDTKDWIKKIGCKAESPEAGISTLSGGNAQKIAIAKWLNTNPSLVILDGPTVGVDIGAKHDIHEILRTLAASGVGVIIISDDMPELLQNCNRILVMRKGVASPVYETTELTEDRLIQLLSLQEAD